MEEFLLLTETRTEKGGSYPRRYLNEGKVPGVVYGQGEKPVSVTVNYRDLRAVLTTEAGLNAIIGLEVEGKHKLSIVKELQRHPLNHNVLHVDFLLINPDEEVQIEVPIQLNGLAKKVEQEQGIVDQILFDLTIMTKPDNIPNLFEFDISDLEVGDSVTVADLTLPPGCRTTLEPDTPVASAELTRMALVEEVPVLEGEEGEEGEEGVEGEEGEEGDGDAEGDSEESGGDDKGGGGKSGDDRGGGGKSGDGKSGDGKSGKEDKKNADK